MYKQYPAVLCNYCVFQLISHIQKPPLPLPQTSSFLFTFCFDSSFLGGLLLDEIKGILKQPQNIFLQCEGSLVHLYLFDGCSDFVTTL